MKTCSCCKLDLSCSEFYSDKRAKDGLQSRCKACHNASVSKWQSANKSKFSEGCKAYYAANKESARIRLSSWRKNNPQKVAAQQKRGRIKFSAKRTKAASLRQAGIYKAQPKWACGFIISEFYDLAKRRTKATGFRWHVDHIIPLKGVNVCGLHVENNLQVIPASMNIRKSNVFIDAQGE